MSYQLVDDKFAHSAKTKKAIRLGGAPAIALWLFMGGAVCRAKSDGLLTEDMIAECADDLRIDPAAVEGLVDALVQSGLLHNQKAQTRCHCAQVAPKVERGGGYLHDWLDWNIAKDESEHSIERLRWRRKKALHRDMKLKELIVARDGEHCRYCAVRVDFADRRSDDGGTYDHLWPDLFEPNEGNFLGGVVVCCRGCNGEKSNRSPEEWVADGGRPLLPPPNKGPRASSPDLAGSGLRPENLAGDQIGGQENLARAESDLISRASGARGGTDQIPIRSGSDPGQIPGQIGSRAARSGRVPERPDRRPDPDRGPFDDDPGGAP